MKSINDQIRAGKFKIDMKGATVDLTAVHVTFPLRIVNATIRAKSAVAFSVGEAGELSLENVRFEMTDASQIAVECWPGSTVAATEVVLNQGRGLVNHGADRVALLDFWSEGDAGQFYFVICADNPTRRFDWKNTRRQVIRAGSREAAVRLMQLDDAHLEGIVTRGAKKKTGKQSMQIRPGGRPGQKFLQIIVANCDFDELDAGNFQDKTDKNYPFARLKYLQLAGCKIGKMHKTFGGKGAFGIDKMEIQKVQRNS